MNKTLRKLVVGGTAAVSASALLMGAAGPAAAWARDGNLENHEFGLFYRTGNVGCVFDLSGEDRNFDDDTFRSGCDGAGARVNDNTESYWNRDAYRWKVGTDKNLGGNVGTLPAGYWGDASATFKNTISSATFIL